MSNPKSAPGAACREHAQLAMKYAMAAQLLGSLYDMVENAGYPFEIQDAITDTEDRVAQLEEELRAVIGC